MALAPLDLLARIEAAAATLRRVPCRLGIDHRSGRFSAASHAQAPLLAQSVLHPLESIGLDPAHECLVDKPATVQRSMAAGAKRSLYAGRSSRRRPCAGAPGEPAFHVLPLDARGDRRPVSIRHRSGRCRSAGLLRADGRLCSRSACEWTDGMQASETLCARASRERCPERAGFYGWLPHTPACTPVLQFTGQFVERSTRHLRR